MFFRCHKGEEKLNYNAIDLKNGYTIISFEHKGVTEEVCLETYNFEKVKKFNLHKNLKKDVVYLFFKEDEKNVYLHRYFAEASREEYVYFVNENWRDLRISNLKKGYPGAKKNPVFLDELNQLNAKQKSIKSILNKKNEVARTSPKKSQPLITINEDEDTNEIIISNGSKQTSLKGISDELKIKIISEIILS